MAEKIIIIPEELKKKISQGEETTIEFNIHKKVKYVLEGRLISLK